MAENWNTLSEQIPHLPNSHAVFDSILEMCLALISGATRCKCVGIRVELEGDFPLVRSRGFSERFVTLARSLLPAGEGGQLDGKGSAPPLEGLCGMVIRGDTAGCEELFSSEGTLWLNDFSDTDRIPPRVRRTMRSACHDEGFQSLALVPCRPNKETLGLLHVCDTRQGLLSEELVGSLQKTGRHFARLVLQLRELESVEAQVHEPGPKPVCILVVDDDEEMSTLVGKMLEAEGHRATCASSASEALDVLSEEKVDLVITDINMPVITGIELARQIKNRWHPYAPPVILMSGSSSEEMEPAEMPPPEAAAFLTKPFTGETLNHAVQIALS